MIQTSRLQIYRCVFSSGLYDGSANIIKTRLCKRSGKQKAVIFLVCIIEQLCQLRVFEGGTTIV